MIRNAFTNELVVTLLLLVVFIGFSIFYLYYKNSKSNSKEKTLTKQSQASKDPKDSQEVVSIILIIEEVYTQSSSSEDGYDEDPEDYEDDFFMDNIRYPFQDVDIHVKYINGFETETPSVTWSIGKVHTIDKDTDGKILWVWVQIYLYYPPRMPIPFEPTPFILRSTLSEDLAAHPISEGNFVLLEYRRRANEEHFSNRPFFIKKILK